MVKEKSKPQGRFYIRHLREGKVINEFDVKNLVTNVGKNYLLGVGFNSGSAITTWYAGLVNNAGFTAADPSDTMASHAGWAEWTNYVESVRQTWPSDAAAGGSIANAVTEMTFTVATAGVVQGLFITSANTKGGTSGTLWNMAVFAAGALTVNVADVLQVSYEYNL